MAGAAVVGLVFAAAAAAATTEGRSVALPQGVDELPSEGEVVRDLKAKLELLGDAFDGGALQLDAYAAAGLKAFGDATRRRPGVALSTRRMQDAAAAAAVPSDMSGKHVKVVTMTDRPFTTMVSAEGQPPEYIGFCPDFLAEVARLANFTYEWVLRTPDQINNGWAGPFIDVHNGDTDMVWATAFLTSARANLVDVSSSYLDSGLQTVSLCDLKKAKAAKLSNYDYMMETLKAPFSPFSLRLWGFTVFAMFGYASLMYILEHPSDLENMDDAERERIPDGIHGIVHGMFNELYLTFTFLTVGAGREPDTTFGKMLLAIMSFFVLVETSMYTANLATQLLLSAQESTQYEDLDDVIANGEKVCVRQGTAMFNMVSEGWPEATLYPVATTASGILHIRDGDCGAMVDSDFGVKFQTIQKENCDMCAVGPRFHLLNFIVGVGQSSPNVNVATINYWIAYLRETGFMRALEANYFEGGGCGKAVGKKATDLVIDIDSMLGMFSLSYY